MPTVLVTGFEPFGGASINPSAQLAETLDGDLLGARGPHRLHGRVLPCAFEAALAALNAAIDDVDPVLVVCTGLAAGRRDLSFERVAVNLVDARIADNLGDQPIDTRVLRSTRDAYFSSLPVKAMVQAAEQAGAPASLSLSAGTFVCNAVFFGLMHRLAADLRRGRKRRGGFVHVPCVPQQVAEDAPWMPSMPLSTMVTGMRAAITCALTARRDLRVSGGEIA